MSGRGRQLTVSKLLSPPNPGHGFLAAEELDLLAALLHLTARQKMVATLLLEGCSRKEIARRLKLGLDTVRVHIDNLFAKFRVRDRLAFGLRIARAHEAIGQASVSLGRSTGGKQKVPGHTRR